MEKKSDDASGIIEDAGDLAVIEMICEAWLSERAILPHEIGQLTIRQIYALGRDRSKDLDKAKWRRLKLKEAQLKAQEQRRRS